MEIKLFLVLSDFIMVRYPLIFVQTTIWIIIVLSNQTMSKTNKIKMDLSLRLKTNNFLSGSKSPTADFFFYGIFI